VKLVGALLAAMTAAAVGVAVAVGTPPSSPPRVVAPEDEPVMTPLTTVALGHRRAVAYLLADLSRSKLYEAATRVAGSVVRVQCSESLDKVTTTHTGSGVVVGLHSVLTARHLLFSDTDDGRLTVLLPTGTHVPAKLVGSGRPEDPGRTGDWMLLEVAADAPALPPVVPIRTVSAESLVVAMGFGASGGLKPDGRAVENDEGEAGGPTWTVGRAMSVGTWTIEPVAGGLGEGGASGGPVIDASGSVVGVFVGASWITSSNDLGEADGRRFVSITRTYRLDAAPVDGVLRWLAKRPDAPR